MTKDLSEFLQKEYSETISTFRTQYTLYVQILTVLIIGNATVIGLAFSTKISGVFILASAFPLGVLVLRYFVSYYMLPIVYVAVSIEERLEKVGIDHLASTYFSFLSSLETYDRLRAFCQIEDREERIQKVKSLAPDFFGKKSMLVSFFFLFLSLFQFLLSILFGITDGWIFY